MMRGFNVLVTYQVIDLSGLIELFRELANKITAMIPDLIVVFIILIVGYIIGKLVGSFVKIFLTKILGLDKWLEMKGLADAAFGISISGFISGIVKWYVYFIFIGLAIEYLKVPFLSPYMSDLVTYFPRIIAASAVFLFGLIAGEWFKERVLETEIIFRDQIASFTKLIVVLVFLIIALQTAMIEATVLIWTLVIILGGVVLAVAIGAGVGLGLALKDELRPIVKRIIEELSKGGEKKS